MVFLSGIEIVEKKRTVLFQMVLLNCYTCGLIVMPFIAWAVPYWRNFLRVIYAPTLLILSYSFFLDESIRWLYSKGKKERAVQLIQKIAKRNGVEIDSMMLDKLDYVDEETKSGVSDMKLLMKTFKSRIMMQRLVANIIKFVTNKYNLYNSSAIFYNNHNKQDYAFIKISRYDINFIITKSTNKKIPSFTIDAFY